MRSRHCAAECRLKACALEDTSIGVCRLVRPLAENEHRSRIPEFNASSLVLRTGSSRSLRVFY